MADLSLKTRELRLQFCLRQYCSLPAKLRTKVVVLSKGKSSTANSGNKLAVLLKGRSFTANSGTKVAVLPKGRSSTANSGTRVADLSKAVFYLQS